MLPFGFLLLGGSLSFSRVVVRFGLLNLGLSALDRSTEFSWMYKSSTKSVGLMVLLFAAATTVNISPYDSAWTYKGI